MIEVAVDVHGGGDVDVCRCSGENLGRYYLMLVAVATRFLSLTFEERFYNAGVRTMSYLHDGFDIERLPAVASHWISERWGVTDGTSASTGTVRATIVDTFESHSRCDVHFPLPVRQFIKLDYHTSHRSSQSSSRSRRLLSVQRRHRCHLINLHPAPPPPIAIRKRQSPPALAFRRAQPQPHQMPPRPSALGGMIRVRRSRMKHVRVTQKLDVADVEHHVQLQAEAGPFEDLGGFELGGREGGNEACRGEAGEGFDVVRVPFGVDSRRCRFAAGADAVASTGTGFEVEDARPYIRILTLRHLPLAVEVPDRLGE